jgi:hypothetical protein
LQIDNPYGFRPKRTRGAQLFTEGSSGQRSPTTGDNIGAGLAAGRFGDEDEAADGLAVTIGGKQVGLATGAGAVEIFHSSHGRLSPSNTGYLTQNDFPNTMADERGLRLLLRELRQRAGVLVLTVLML